MMSVGRIGTLECDFVARRAFGEYFYIQVAMTIADRATENREDRPFEKITDSYPRYLFTLDPLLQQREGVRHLNLMEFIVSGGDLVSSN